MKVSLPQTPWDRLAIFISEIANPVFVALPTFFLVENATSPDLLHTFLWWIVTAVGISIAPFLFILRGVRRGTYSDHHVSRREQRLVPLLFGIGCVSSVFILLLLLHASRPLIATLTAVIVALCIATLITRHWKISFHLVGVAGAITALSLLYGPIFLLLAPIVVLVAWARWQVHAHTPLQALAGTALAVGVTITTFWIFRLF